MRRFPELGLLNCEALLTNRSTNNLNSRDAELRSDSNTRGAYTLRYFQEGDLKIVDYELSVDNAEKIMMVKQYYDGFNRPAFVRAMIGIFKIEYYNHTQLLQKLANNPTAMQHCANVTQYKLMLEDIYNFRSREKVSLRF